MSENILSDVKKYVSEFFKNNSPVDNVYHSFEHTLDVVRKVKEISGPFSLNKIDLEIVQIAAWFHDTGHIETWENHEEQSAAIARSFLESINYDIEKIEKVRANIIATKLLHRPQNLSEKIIKDADLSYLGSSIFFERSSQLKVEVEKREKRIISELDWLKINIDFLSVHYYWTDYSVKNFNNKKNENLIVLRELYSKELEKTQH